MNKEQLEKIVRNYMNKLDYLNNDEHAEYYKWIALRHFQAHWDIDADNFGEMFKEAYRRSENLIDNRIVQPGNGISFLCKDENGSMEMVRTEFKRLLENDQNDYRQRLQKIDTFIDNINAMLQKAVPGKWKYEQDRRAVIMYLSLIEPESNYMYKATCAKAFADAVEFGDDIGSGQTFSLTNYYRMCDELAGELHKQSELLELYDAILNEHEDSLNEIKLKDVDPSLHILVYDLIYCTKQYDLYSGMIIKTKSKSSSALQLQEERKQQMKQLARSIEEKDIELTTISAEIEEIGIPDCMGLSLKHSKYGQGIVVNQEGRYLTVRFGLEDKSFKLPAAIANGFLKTDSLEIAEKCKALSELCEQQEKKVKEIRHIRTQLDLF